MGEVADNPVSGHNGPLGNGERAFVVIYPASCAEQDDETVAKMGHPDLSWVRPGPPAHQILLRVRPEPPAPPDAQSRAGKYVPYFDLAFACEELLASQSAAFPGPYPATELVSTPLTTGRMCNHNPSSKEFR
jgi:hypothetical protein